MVKLKMTCSFHNNEHLCVFVGMVHNFEIELWLFIWNMSLGWAQKALSQAIFTKVHDNKLYATQNYRDAKLCKRFGKCIRSSKFY